MERFVDIPDAPGYQVGDGGSIVRVAKAQGTSTGPVKSTPNKAGYHTVSLRVGGRTVTRYVHDLVGKAFLKGFKPGMNVNHRDRDRNNNAVKNLEIMDGADNKGHGRLTSKGVMMIKALARKKWPVLKIAKALKLRPGVVQTVLRNGQ